MQLDFSTRASSIPSGLYFSPSLPMSKLLKRPFTYRKPSVPIYPRSPVYNHPLRMVSAVLDGFFQYPAITFSPLITISPACPTGNSFPSLSQIFNSMGATNIPLLPKVCLDGTFDEITGVASLKPYP